jgi:hypothetical protein
MILPNPIPIIENNDRFLHKDVQIFVVASPLRESLILNHLKGIPYRVFYVPNHEIPENWKPHPKFSSLAGSTSKAARGALRCYLGHQACLRALTSPVGLILEDDAVPNRQDWLSIVNRAVPYLKERELISLHGREWNFAHFREEPFVGNLRLFSPSDNFERRVLGSLSYLIKRESSYKITDLDFDGYPVDLAIANYFEGFGVVHPSPFDHDKTFGSLID